MNSFKEIIADVLFVFHQILVFIIVFGWAFENLEFIYSLTLIATLFSWLFLKGCILTQLEFKLRNSIEEHYALYDDSFVNYYTFKVMGNRTPSKKVIEPLVWIFLIGSIITHFYFKYLF